MPWMSFQVNCELFRLLAYSGIPHMGCLALSHIYDYYPGCLYVPIRMR
jgi:hypothetical protein